MLVARGVSFDPATSTGSNDTEQDDISNSANSHAIIFLSIFLIATLLLLMIAGHFLQRGQETDSNNQRGATQNGGKETDERTAEQIKSCLKIREWNDSNAASLNQNQPEMTRIHFDAGGVGSELLPGEVVILGKRNEKTDIETGIDQPSNAEDMGTDESDQCSICLTNFSPRQLVCESPNSDCNHVFHEKCIISWLHKNRECPICRRDYLAEEDDSAFHDEEETTRGSSSNSTVSSSSDQSDAR